MKSLEVGKEYKVKFSWTKRATCKTYDGDRHSSEYSDEEHPNGIAIFSGNGGVVYAPYEDIVFVEEVKQTVNEKKERKICPRCLGNNLFKHLSHVNGGKCFKCGGTGYVE